LTGAILKLRRGQNSNKEASVMKKLIVALVLPAIVIGTIGCGGAGSLGLAGKAIPFKDESFTVSPLGAMTLTINMRKGAVLEGYVTVRRGNDDIRFYVKDSYGNIVLDIDRTRGRYDFNYTATNEGFHTVYLDNSFSLVTSKQVFLHYRVR